MPPSSYLRSALFVDFDNIFLGFERQQSEAAELFASSPDKWVRWLEQEASTSYGDPESPGFKRKILARRCYINPRSFHEHRPHFIRAGFEVVDCPPLTSQGKTSADIHMVLDMLDALAHPTRFDEFIVLSGDADFTPVLLRLRKHDRRTMVLAVGPSSPAYRASSDYLLDENQFLERGLGIEDVELAEPPQRSPLSRSTRATLKEIASRLEEMSSITGQISVIELPGIYKRFPRFKEGENWLDFYSLRRMTEAVVNMSDSLKIVDEDPWWVESHKKEAISGTDTKELPTLAEVKTAVQDIVAQSDSPVVLASLAQKISQKFGDSLRLSGWHDSGSFKHLLERLDLASLRFSTAASGYVFDPERHEPPESQAKTEERKAEAEIPAIARKVTRLTDMPLLPTSRYATVFQEIAKEVNGNGYHLTRTSKAVRDRCAGKEIRISRSHVSVILKGIVFSGHRFQESHETPSRLGEALVKNIFDLCSRSQVDLTAEEVQATKDWILGKSEEPDA